MVFRGRAHRGGQRRTLIEILDALRMGIRRKRIDAASRDAALARLDALSIAVDPESDRHAWTTTRQLANRFRLTAYDAVYLELAQRGNLPLATLDRDLRAAGAALGVTLLGSVAPSFRQRGLMALRLVFRRNGETFYVGKGKVRG